MKKLADKYFDRWLNNYEGIFQPREVAKLKNIFRFRLEGEIALKQRAVVSNILWPSAAVDNVVKEYWEERTWQPYQNIAAIEYELSTLVSIKQEVFQSLSEYAYVILKEIWDGNE